MKNKVSILSVWAWHFARSICLIAMLILTPVVFVNVITRFVFGYSIAWSSEVARYSFLWLTFMGMAVALKEDSHAKIDLLIKLSPLRMRTFIILSGHLIVMILSIVLIIAGTLQTVSVWGVKAAYMRFLSMSWMYLSIPLSGLIMLLFTTDTLIALWDNRKTVFRSTS